MSDCVASHSFTSDVFGIGRVLEPAGECLRHIFAECAAAFNIPVHFDGDTTGEEQFADGTNLFVCAVVFELVGHVFIDELVAVNSEFVFKGRVVPRTGGNALAVVAANFGVLPEVDNHTHGCCHATGRAVNTVFDRAPKVIGLNLIPFGLYKDGLAVGIASEGLVDQFVPTLFGLGAGNGVGVLVFTD